MSLRIFNVIILKSARGAKTVCDVLSHKNCTKVSIISFLSHLSSLKSSLKQVDENSVISKVEFFCIEDDARSSKRTSECWAMVKEKLLKAS